MELVNRQTRCARHPLKGYLLDNAKRFLTRGGLAGVLGLGEYEMMEGGWGIGFFRMDLEGDDLVLTYVDD